MKINAYPMAPEYGGEYMEKCIKLSSTSLPEWYKKSSSYGGDPEDKKFLPKRMTIKKCMPVFDYLSYGVNLYLPFSVFVEGKYPEQEIWTMATGQQYCGLGQHSIEQKQLYPNSELYNPQPYKIDFPYYIETPKGYSSLYVQPNNEISQGVHFVQALVSTDNYKNQVNFPFLIRKDFEGILHAGTHFMTMFFIKRDTVELNYNTYEQGAKKINPGKTMVANWGGGFYKKIRNN